MKPVVFAPAAREELEAAVFYRELSDCIEIVAVAHGARHPEYWVRRR